MKSWNFMFDTVVPADVIQIGELAIVKGCDLGEKHTLHAVAIVDAGESLKILWSSPSTLVSLQWSDERTLYLAMRPKMSVKCLSRDSCLWTHAALSGEDRLAVESLHEKCQTVVKEKSSLRTGRRKRDSTSSQRSSIRRLINC